MVHRTSLLDSKRRRLIELGRAERADRAEGLIHHDISLAAHVIDYYIIDPLLLRTQCHGMRNSRKCDQE